MSLDKSKSAINSTLSIFSLLEWLNGEPKFDEICRGIVLAYMHQFSPSNSQVLRLTSDDSLQVEWIAFDEVNNKNLHPSFANTWPKLLAILKMRFV